MNTDMDKDVMEAGSQWFTGMLKLRKVFCQIETIPSSQEMMEMKVNARILS